MNRLVVNPYGLGSQLQTRSPSSVRLTEERLLASRPLFSGCFATNVPDSKLPSHKTILAKRLLKWFYGKGFNTDAVPPELMIKMNTALKLFGLSAGLTGFSILSQMLHGVLLQPKFPKLAAKIPMDTIMFGTFLASMLCVLAAPIQILLGLKDLKSSKNLAIAAPAFYNSKFETL